MAILEGMVGVYFTDSITWVRAAGVDQWGEPLTATEVSIRARVNWKTRLVRNFAGEQVIAAGTVLVSDKPSHEDNVEIDGVLHVILAIHEKKVFATVSHYEVFFA